jgi:hypothetical protein
MRKGLVATLGVVALVLAVSPGFAVAPVIQCIPDIVVSDVEDNTVTDDLNFFIFRNALNLDDYVSDADTPVDTLRWSFVESSPGGSININSIGSNTSGNFEDPGAFNIRATTGMITVENVAWSGTAGTTASMQSTIEMYCSDGTPTGTVSQTVMIETINDTTDPPNDGPGDALRTQPIRSYTFASGAENWAHFDLSGLTPVGSYNSTGGSLSQIENAGQTLIVFGAWESTKQPQDAGGEALQARFGCITRARFALTSPDGMGSPGFRLRANWTHVLYNASAAQWVTDFQNMDFNDNVQILYNTQNLFHIAGREPGAAGQTYALLYYPQQIETLMSTDAIVYLGFDLIDDDFGSGDSGDLSCSQVDVDMIHRPAEGTGRAEAGLTHNSFTGWPTATQLLDPTGVTGGVVTNAGATEMSIGFTTADQLFEASVVGPTAGVAIEPGRYYRLVFMVTSSQVAGADLGPLIRTGFVSSRFVYAADKMLLGGGTWSAIGSTPEPYEMWVEAPSANTGSTLTEPMQLRFATYVTFNFDVLLGRNQSGTIRCSEIRAESYPAWP